VYRNFFWSFKELVVITVKQLSESRVDLGKLLRGDREVAVCGRRLSRSRGRDG
jgi:hypothetical protein